MLGRCILVPVDGSPFGQRAIPLATEIARRTEGSIRLVTVQTPWPRTELPDMPGVAVENAEKSIAQGLQRHLDETAAAIREAGVEVHAELRLGAADREIVAASTADGCDLIAMSSHGRGGFERVWLGSVADRVARHATVPVLLVPGGEDGDADDPVEPSIGTVIVPLDGSAFAERALSTATAIGDLFSTDYILYRAVAARTAIGSPYMAHAVHVERELLETERGAAKHYMDEVAGRFEEARFSTTVVVAEDAGPVEGLLRLANTEPRTLIVMTTHGRGGFRRAILGSTADKVIRGARRPVLLVRPEDAES